MVDVYAEGWLVCAAGYLSPANTANQQIHSG